MRKKPFKCSVCDQPISDGNVMVGAHEFFTNNRVGFLKVVCKPCTRRVDREPGAEPLHNLWELQWILRHPVHLMASVLNALMQPKSPATEWAPQAVADFYCLFATAHPGLAVDPLAVPPAVTVDIDVSAEET